MTEPIPIMRWSIVDIVALGNRPSPDLRPSVTCRFLCGQGHIESTGLGRDGDGRILKTVACTMLKPLVIRMVHSPGSSQEVPTLVKYVAIASARAKLLSIAGCRSVDGKVSQDSGTTLTVAGQQGVMQVIQAVKAALDGQVAEPDRSTELVKVLTDKASLSAFLELHMILEALPFDGNVFTTTPDLEQLLNQLMVMDCSTDVALQACMKCQAALAAAVQSKEVTWSATLVDALAADDA
jgi:hypothetical protein